MALSITNTNTIGGIKTFPGGAVNLSTSTIDVSLGTHFTKTITGATTFSVTNVPEDVACSFVLEIVSGSAASVSWWENIVWGDYNSPPTLKQRDYIRFTLVDGVWYGAHFGKDLRSAGQYGWIATLGGASGDYGYGMAVDSSGNVYVTGGISSQGAGNEDVLIAKYDTSGTLLWQRVLGGASSDYGLGIAVDSSGNVYVTGYTQSQGAGSGDVLIAKYNTSGTIQWQRTLGGANIDYGYGIAVDSSGNVYVTGNTASQGAGSLDVLIAKYNTSGTIQWQRVLGGASSDVGNGIAVDSSGNVYIIGSTFSQGAGNGDVLIAKYNTSGTIQWQRTLGGASSDYGYGIAVDSSGNVYVTGSTFSQGAGGRDVLIAKYDTSGTIQWQRTLGGASSDGGYGIAVDSFGNVYVTGYTPSQGAGSDDVLIAKLPGDGSGTGSYFNNTIFYAQSFLTGATSTLTSATSTLTNSSSTLTGATSTLTGATSTLISTQDVI